MDHKPRQAFTLIEIGEACRARAGACGPGAGPTRAGSLYAFTLIELLVVVSIVALLAALLLPALNSAKSHAKRVECLTYMRQIGMGLTAYRDDNKGYVYPKYITGAHSWPTIIDEYLGGRGRKESWIAVTTKVWACPVNEPQGYTALRTTGWAMGSRLGYVVNRATTWDDSPTPPQLAAQIHHMAKPSRAAYVVETVDRPAAWASWSPTYWGYPPAVQAFLGHQNGANLLAMDGHVEMAGVNHALYSVIQSEWWKRTQ